MKLSSSLKQVVPDLIQAHTSLLNHRIGLCGSRSFIKLKLPVMPSVGDILRDGKFDENIESFRLDIYFYVENVQHYTELI